MADRPSWPTTDHPPEWPAWCVSLVVHVTILVVILLLARNPAVRGAAEEATRDVGIVLKQVTDDGPMFEGEADQPPTDKSLSDDTAVGDAAITALPSTAEIPSTEAALPDQSLAGIGQIESGDLAAASEMTAGGAPSRAVGGNARVQVFGIEGEGTRFVYLFDRSTSMEGAPLRAARQQLIASLDALDSVHQFQIIFFHHEPQIWEGTGRGGMVFASDRNKMLAERFVNSISAAGGTYRLSALRMAVRFRPDVVFFLTDADDPMSGGELADIIQLARRHGTAIHCIDFGDGPQRNRESYLKKLARDTGGRYVYVDVRQLGR